ncbi:MAG: hypothetical protein J6S29_01905 [Methanosphaera sp.]|nr:hypothetical protein [Methanosphaera sp.]
MNNKSLLFLIGIVAAIGIICLFLGTLNQYPDNLGEVTATDGNVSFTYNNDKNSQIYWKWDNGSTAPVYNEYKNLTGNVTIDLNNVVWDEDYEPISSANHPTGSVNTEYAKEHVVDDLKNEINNSNLDAIKGSDDLNLTYSISYYDENGTEVAVTDYSSDSSSEDDIIKSIVLDGDKLKLELYKNYQVNATEEVSGSDSHTNTMVEQSGINKVKYAILNLDFEGIENEYHFMVNLKDDVFNSSHM